VQEKGTNVRNLPNQEKGLHTRKESQTRKDLTNQMIKTQYPGP
jgi:hypothetical protein